MSSSSISATPSWADRLGIWTSAACVVHCLLTPVLLSCSVALVHFLPSEEKTHRTLAVVVASLGTVALVRGYRRHRRVRVLLLTLGGLACVGAAAWWGQRLPNHAYEVAVTLTGSAALIAAHRLNHTFCKSCACVPPAGRL